MDRRKFLAGTAALAGSDARQARARARRDRSLVLLSDRGRRPDHQDHRRLRGRFREGQSVDQGEADLFRHLSGKHHQGADRAQERHAAGHLGAALDRHVHADRRGSDRADRRLPQDRRRQEVDGELLPGLHGKQPDRRQDLGRAVPALHHRALLQQGPVQGGGPRPREAARDLGRACSASPRSSPSATHRATRRNGACRFPRPASPTGCSRG